MSPVICRCVPGGIFCLLLLLAAGCASPQGEFRSKKDPAYSDKLRRVLIVYHNEEESIHALGRSFGDVLLKRLTESLGQKGVISETVRPTGDALDENAPVRAAVDRFHPQQALHFGWSGSSTRTGWSVSGELPRFTQETSTKFAFALIAGARAETVWRGAVSYYVLPDAKAVADQFVQQMVKEGFLLGP
jgi:hypothetical protein